MNAQVVPADRSSADLQSPGKQLRSAREARGLDLEHTARMLHLPPATLAAIEADAHEALPGPVFVRGYLRNYARLLNLDEEAVLASLNPTRPPESVRPPRVRTSARQEIRSSHIAVRLVSWLIVLSVAGFLYLWWVNPTDLSSVFSSRPTTSPLGEPKPITPSQSTSGKGSSPVSAPTAPAASKVEPSAPFLVNQSPPGKTPAPPPASAAPPTSKVDQAPAPVKPAEPTPQVPAPQRVEPPAISAAATARSPTPPGTEKPPLTTSIPAETAPSASSQAVVVLEFSDTAWVDVRDATKKVHIRGEMRKGERRELGGTPPYTLVLGNAGSVQVTVNGEPFDLKSRIRGNVARFTLNPKTGE